MQMVQGEIKNHLCVKSRIRISHENIANFECDQCGLKCVTNTPLQKHNQLRGSSALGVTKF